MPEEVKPSSDGTCAVCGKRFKIVRPLHRYCRPGCKMQAYWQRRLARGSQDQGPSFKDDQKP